MHDQNFLYHIQISQPTDTLAKSRVIIKLKAKLFKINQLWAADGVCHAPRFTPAPCHSSIRSGVAPVAAVDEAVAALSAEQWPQSVAA